MEPICAYFDPQPHEVPSAAQTKHNQDVYRLMHVVAQRVDIQVRLALGPIPRLPQTPTALLPGLMHVTKIGLMSSQSDYVNLLYQDICNGALYTLRNQLPDSSFVSDSVSLSVLYALGKQFRIKTYIKKVAFEEMYTAGLITSPETPRLRAEE